MAAFPGAGGVLIALLSADSISPQQGLLRVALISAVLLCVHLLRAVLKRVSLPFPLACAVVSSLGIGSAFCLGLRALFPALTPLSPEQPLTAMLLMACGAAVTEKSPFALRLLPAAVLIGAARELLSEGSLWGVTLLPIGIAPALGNGAGGLLIAALVLWCFGLNRPVLTEEMPKTAVLTSMLLAAIASVLGIVTSSLPTAYAVWGIVTLLCAVTVVLPEKYAPKTWVIVLPAAILLTRSMTLWWPPILVGLSLLAAIVLIGSLHRRLHLTPPPRRFRGAPAALAIAAVVACIATALPDVSLTF